MKVSCIIPTKDRAKFITKALLSALRQQVPVHEIIIVDDGSTDGTSEVLQKLTALGSIKVINTRGRGPGGARNVGVANSSGDILMFLDSDDEWLENHVKELLTGHIKGYEACFGRTINFNSISGEVFFIPDLSFAMSDCFYRDLLRWCHLVPSSFSVTKDAFNDSNGFPEDRIGEDWLFFLKLSEGRDFYYSKEVITRRTLHNSSLCQKEFTQLKALSILNKIFELASRSQKTHDEDLKWLKNAIQVTENSGKNWRSVQEWYQGLKKEGLL